ISNFSLSLGTTAGGTQTTATLTFPTAAGFMGGSLPDGNYSLQIDSTKVTDGSGNELDGAGTGAGSTRTADSFLRLFGDVLGIGVVNNQDASLLRQIYGQSTSQSVNGPYFDYNGDGQIDKTDLAQFKLRLGSGLTGLFTTGHEAPAAGATLTVDAS